MSASIVANDDFFSLHNQIVGAPPTYTEAVRESWTGGGLRGSALPPTPGAENQDLDDCPPSYDEVLGQESDDSAALRY